MRIPSILLTSIFFVFSAVAIAHAGQIRVAGQGSVASVPDMATITLGVTNQAKTAASALSANSAATRDVLKQITAAGIKPRDVQTSGLSLTPRWKNTSSSGGQRPAISGYDARNQVSVRVRDLSILGQVLDSVVKSGANTFHGLQFGLQDPQPVMEEARKRAVADAMRKAALYSAAAGVELGAIAEINEQGGGGPAPVMRHEMAMSEAVPIAQGEVAVAASIHMVFDISQ